ncbi:MAG: hypothetical protein WD941_05655, partial [Opitutus sp.]
MSRAPESSAFPAGRFRLKLMVAMMLVVSGITALAVYLAERNLAVATGQELQREFRLELEALHRVHALREAALLERCRALVRKPRIHAAFEDDALDLLYPSARDELRDIMDSPDTGNDNAAYALRAEFYRFLGRDGGLLAPDAESHAGVLRPAEEAQLRLPVLPDKPQFGFLRSGMEPDAEIAAEIIAMPIISWETDRPIAALILGFRPVALDDGSTGSGIRRGLWLDGRLHMRGLSTAERAAFTACMAAAMDSNPAASDDGGEACDVEGRMHRLFHKQLNPGSLYPPAFEVCVYPLAPLQARQRQVRWRLIAAGALLLLGGFSASHFLAGRLSRPVEKLAVDSEQHVAERDRAEAALESTSVELQRAARFSADASHQLKTPVAVLRAGLE